jgi:GNAT superfamily N-acetyltransferase
LAGKFLFKKFSEIDLGDHFFDGLKTDYPGNANSTGFSEWFNKKAAANSTALVFDDDDGLGAFVYLKDEDEPIELAATTLPAMPRVKIGTLRLAERYRGQRLGEGAIGLALWKWQQTKKEEIYVTVFEKHDTLIGLFERFGFRLAGVNSNGERVYIKSRKDVDYTDPYKSFPFVNPAFQNAGYLIVEDVYHDTLFPYSELSNTLQEQVALSAANGISKVYIGSPTSMPPYRLGEPILIYRKYTGNAGSPGYKSCVTSYCMVTNVIIAKENNQYKMSVEDLLRQINNKSVFDENEIRTKYGNERTLVVIEMLYCGFFGAGNNVNWAWLKNNNFWPYSYPTTARLTQEQFKAILREGNVDVPNVIIN